MLIKFTDSKIPKNGVNDNFVKSFTKQYNPRNGDTGLPWLRKDQKWLNGFTVSFNGKSYCLKSNDQGITNHEFLIYKINDKIGFGIITLKPIKKGEVLFLFGTERTTDKDTLVGGTTAGGIIKGHYFHCENYAGLSGLLNHAPKNLDNNCEERLKEKANIATENLCFSLYKKKWPCVEANRNISKYEVLVFDYGDEYFFTLNIRPRFFYKTGHLMPSIKNMDTVGLTFRKRIEGSKESNCINTVLSLKEIDDWTSNSIKLNMLRFLKFTQETHDIIKIYHPAFGEYFLNAKTLKEHIKGHYHCWECHIQIEKFALSIRTKLKPMLKVRAPLDPYTLDEKLVKETLVIT